MRPERAPRRAKIDPKNSQRVPKLPPGDKQCNFNDFLKLSGVFLEPFWAKNQGKNQWILVAAIGVQKTNTLYTKNDIKHDIKIKFIGWRIQRFKPKYIMWKSLNSYKKTMFLKDQHVFEIWKNIKNIIQHQCSKMCWTKCKNWAKLNKKMKPKFVKK